MIRFSVFGSRFSKSDARAYSAALLLLLITSVNNLHADTVSGSVRKGNELYKEGQYSEALTEYNEALKKAPNHSVVNYDAGAAYYKSKDYKSAEEVFTKALVSEDKTLDAKTNYNIGNVKYRLGEPLEKSNTEGAVKLYKEALDYYKRAIELDDKDEDAKFNYEFVKKKIEELQNKKSENKENKNNQEQQENKDNKEPKKDQKEENKQNQNKNEEQKNKEEEKQRQQQQEQQEKEQQKEREEQKKQEEQKKNENTQDNEKKEPNESKNNEKKNEKPESDEENGAPEEEPSGANSGEPEDLTKEQAEMLLEGFRQEEESKSGKEKKAYIAGGEDNVLKDW